MLSMINIIVASGNVIILLSCLIIILIIGGFTQWRIGCLKKENQKLKSPKSLKRHMITSLLEREYNPEEIMNLLKEAIQSAIKTSMGKGFQTYFIIMNCPDSLLLDIPEIWFFAAEEGDLEVIKILINRGLIKDLNIRNPDGKTASHIAVINSQWDVVIDLCAREGVDISLEDNRGKVLRDYLPSYFKDFLSNSDIMSKLNNIFGKNLSDVSTDDSSCKHRSPSNPDANLIEEVYPEGYNEESVNDGHPEKPDENIPQNENSDSSDSLLGGVLGEDGTNNSPNNPS
jgi:hypothetical protein